MKRVKRFAAALGSLMLAPTLLQGCAPNIPQGWSLRERCGNGHCWNVGISPDGGQWLNFKIGMPYEGAVQAACSAAGHGDLTFDLSPVSWRDGRCVIVKDAQKSGATMWSGKASGFWCWPLGAAQTIYFEFDDKNYRLTRIAAYCPPIDP